MGDTLGQLGDPRPGVGLRSDGLPDIVWCEAPGGRFRISKYPITVSQYTAFVQAGGYEERRFWRVAEAAGHWRDGKVRTYGWHEGSGEYRLEWFDGPVSFGARFDGGNHPMVGVSWYEALAFCEWLSEQLRLRLTLPTEDQWHQASGGADSRIYPWGKGITPDHANYAETSIGATTAVGIFPRGASPCDAMDMSGNVWEWCCTKWRENYKDRPDDNLEGDAARVLPRGRPLQ